ncbi:MAG TPA: DUF4332 domain-containing protein [Planctomycetaceae bacterium]|nr:DUF4332 domain-containing protein [Planctomycetaceae bacterium]
MSFLLSVLRAAHCRSTHHFFVIDSTKYVDTPAGRRLVNVLLKHHERFLAGAKDPDDRFRDFQNHCVHVRTGYWGGAPRLALTWYERMRDYLAHGRYADAAYAAGVMSHYFTDPLQPLHTAQTEREPLVHRAIEWSVRCCYDEILTRWTQDEYRAVFQLGGSEAWLAEAILKGARFANHSYDRLVESYDLERGTKDPTQGLDDAAKTSFASLFGLAITGLARIWERVADEAESVGGKPIPQMVLTFDGLFATLQVPEKWIIKRIQNQREREQVQKVFDEYSRTGKLVENVPDECFVKQQVWMVYQREAAWRNRSEASDVLKNSTPHVPATLPFPSAKQSQADVQPSQADSASTTNPRTVAAIVGGMARIRLRREDPLVDAPSIGPKTATRFADIGVQRVGDFLDEAADSLAARLDIRWITTKMISDWQAQAKLMCEVPGLLARDTQLLVGIGYRTAAQVHAATAETLHREILRFANTSDGKRAIRNSSVPDINAINDWIKLSPGRTAKRDVA